MIRFDRAAMLCLRRKDKFVFLRRKETAGLQKDVDEDKKKTRKNEDEESVAAGVD